MNPGPDRDAPLRVHVTRDACCGADDQAGPLDAVFDVDPQASLAALVARIAGAGFWQFSSSHRCLTGEVEGLALVAVSADGGAPQFHVDPETPVAELLRGRPLHFAFRHRRSGPA